MAIYTQLQTTRIKHYALKDKKITIWKMHEGEDEEGTTVHYWEKFKTLWAHYRQSSGKEQNEAHEAGLEQVEDAHFIVNYYDWLNDTSYKLSYKGRVYNITRIDNYEDYHRELEITATWSHDYTEADLEEQANEYRGTKSEE